jgi:hypothetical protein
VIIIPTVAKSRGDYLNDPYQDGGYLNPNLTASTRESSSNPNISPTP